MYISAYSTQCWYSKTKQDMYFNIMLFLFISMWHFHIKNKQPLNGTLLLLSKVINQLRFYETAIDVSSSNFHKTIWMCKYKKMLASLYAECYYRSFNMCFIYFRWLVHSETEMESFSFSLMLLYIISSIDAMSLWAIFAEVSQNMTWFVVFITNCLFFSLICILKPIIV